MTYSTAQGTHLRFAGGREGQSIFLTESAPRVLLFSQPEDWIYYQREGVIYEAVENLYCEINEYASSNDCFPCPPGTTNSDRENAFDGDTSCAPVICVQDERVQNHTCVPCQNGWINDGGDDASGFDTVCDPVMLFCSRASTTQK